jgi:hypothetical protein
MMEIYSREGSNDKPIVILDPLKGTVFLGGASLPENVLDVYSPILDWLEAYIQNPQPNTKIDFFFEYLNTASSHMIMRIFEKIKSLKTGCSDVCVNWHYLKGDHDMRDFGKELVEEANFPINIIDSDHFQIDLY